MFREVKATSQKPGQPKRRWFSSSDMDLFIWATDENVIVSYQLSYNKPQSEKALLWSEEKGVTHHSVDDGSHPGKHPGSPLLIADGALNLPRLIFMINKNFREIEPEIKNFIISNIINLYK